MDSNGACPTCKSPVPSDAPGGACPRCLMAIAFASDAGAIVRDVAPDDVVERFPGYEVLGTIGRGGMGVVFRARQKALDREVALKVLPGGASRPAGFTERFEREAKALARLQHPGIVQVFDFGTSADGWCFLAMELVDGVNLRRALADGRLAPKQALAIVPQICDALQYAHDRGVVHRDIKPENLLLTRDGRVKVADFGLAKLMESSAADRALTGAGQVMGTPHYMAPEQVESPGDVDHRADIYSLGVVFYEMLTGELPIGRFAAPSKKSDVDARIDDVVLRTLEKERSARYQKASYVKTALGSAADREAGEGRHGEAELRSRLAPSPRFQRTGLFDWVMAAWLMTCAALCWLACGTNWGLMFVIAQAIAMPGLRGLRRTHFGPHAEERDALARRRRLIASSALGALLLAAALWGNGVDSPMQSYDQFLFVNAIGTVGFVLAAFVRQWNPWVLVIWFAFVSGPLAWMAQIYSAYMRTR